MSQCICGEICVWCNRRNFRTPTFSYSRVRELSYAINFVPQGRCHSSTLAYVHRFRLQLYFILRMYTCRHRHTDTHRHAHTRARAHTHTHTHTRARTHMRVHTDTHNSPFVAKQAQQVLYCSHRDPLPLKLAGQGESNWRKKESQDIKELFLNKKARKAVIYLQVRILKEIQLSTARRHCLSHDCLL